MQVGLRSIMKQPRNSFNWKAKHLFHLKLLAQPKVFIQSRKNRCKHKKSSRKINLPLFTLLFTRLYSSPDNMVHLFSLTQR